MDVSVFLFFGPPDVVDHAVLFAEFGEELVEETGFNDLIGMALGLLRVTVIRICGILPSGGCRSCRPVLFWRRKGAI